MKELETVKDLIGSDVDGDRDLNYEDLRQLAIKWIKFMTDTPEICLNCQKTPCKGFDKTNEHDGHMILKNFGDRSDLFGVKEFLKYFFNIKDKDWRGY